MDKLAKYDWKRVDGGSTSAVTLYTNEMVAGEGKSPPTVVAAAVKFMFVTGTKELRTEDYEITWCTTYPLKCK